MNVIDRSTIDFQLFDVFEVDSFCGRGRFADHDRTSLEAVLNLAERISLDHLWPHAAKADMDEPYLENGQVRVLPEVIDALGVLRDAGFFSAHCDYDLGGMQLPVSVNHACNGMMKAANVSAHGFMSLTRATANLLAVHGTDEQKKRFMNPMYEGRFFGTMCLSEPEAGSSVGDLTTRANPAANGVYHVRGNKMWISAGDHDAAENIVHLVLARIDGAPAGPKGISLFAVPKFLVEDDGRLGSRNGITVAGLNHKMGYRGISNCLLNFGESTPATGYLVGRPNEGLACMFHMMNEARIGVGTGAAALASSGYQIARAYARERKQGRPLGRKDPSTGQVPLTAHPDVRRMLLQQKAYAEGGMALCTYAATLVDRAELSDSGEERGHLSDLLDILTPMVKAWPSEFGLRANEVAIQVLGGYGYTRDFPVERLYRDNRLNMIHEGTNGIQALDLLGRKSIQNGGRAWDALKTEIIVSVKPLDGAENLRRQAAEILRLLDLAEATIERAQDLTGTGKHEQAFAHATPFLWGLGHLVVGWLWLRMAETAIRMLKDSDAISEAEFCRGKLDACHYFFQHELPMAEAWLNIAGSEPDVLLGAEEAAL